MSKTNDTSKLDRAPQVRELRDDELQEVSGGIVAPRDLNSGRSVGIISAPVDAHSGQMSMGTPMLDWLT